MEGVCLVRRSSASPKCSHRSRYALAGLRFVLSPKEWLGLVRAVTMRKQSIGSSGVSPASMVKQMRRLLRKILRKQQTRPEAGIESPLEKQVTESANGAYFDMATRRLDAQMEQIDSMDSKTVNVFLIASTVLPITASLISDAGPAIQERCGAKLALVFGLAAYFWTTYYFVRAYRLAEWKLRPNLRSLKKFSQTRSEERSKRWIANQCAQSYFENKQGIMKKSYFATRTFLGLATEVAALTVAVLIVLLF